MKERPIIFSGPMVRAILDGRKTQTRRAVKPQPEPATCHPQCHAVWRQLGETDQWRPHWLTPRGDGGHYDDWGEVVRCPYGSPGERLWVRETFGLLSGETSTEWMGIEWEEETSIPILEPTWIYQVVYCADDIDRPETGWRPSIHMPRWASRITLEIARVRVERLQDISEEDAEAEGPTYTEDASAFHDSVAVCMFAHGWQQINGKRPGCSWADNPWVWVLTFRKLEAA